MTSIPDDRDVNIRPDPQGDQLGREYAEWSASLDRPREPDLEQIEGAFTAVRQRCTRIEDRLTVLAGMVEVLQKQICGLRWQLIDLTEEVKNR